MFTETQQEKKTALLYISISILFRGALVRQKSVFLNSYFIVNISESWTERFFFQHCYSWIKPAKHSALSVSPLPCKAGLFADAGPSLSAVYAVACSDRARAEFHRAFHIAAGNTAQSCCRTPWKLCRARTNITDCLDLLKWILHQFSSV